jgi:hypothetical protein
MLGGMNYAPELWRDFAVTAGGPVGGVINAWLFLLKVPSQAGAGKGTGPPAP